MPFPKTHLYSHYEFDHYLRWELQGTIPETAQNTVSKQMHYDVPFSRHPFFYSFLFFLLLLSPYLASYFSLLILFNFTFLTSFYNPKKKN
jgi:protein-S-isoprenylcysteine O-methyltransferase Ste14